MLRDCSSLDRFDPLVHLELRKQNVDLSSFKSARRSSVHAQSERATIDLPPAITPMDVDGPQSPLAVYQNVKAMVYGSRASISKDHLAKHNRNYSQMAISERAHSRLDV